jgi:hypothetical protein
MWGDVDHGTAGHKKGEALPPTVDDALLVVRGAGLGEPTILIHSGGGLYPLWMLDRPVDRDDADRLSKWTQQALLAASERHGWTYGTGVGDLARVLRLPGSVNRKTEKPRPCRLIGGTGLPISPDAIPEPASRAHSSSMSAPAVVPLPGRREYVPSGDIGPADVIDAMCGWAEILQPAGWVFVGLDSQGYEMWLRPGDATSAYSARAFVHNLVCHSESAGLPVGKGQRLTKARVYAYLWHAGDVSTAMRSLLRGDIRGGLRPDVLAAINAARQRYDSERFTGLIDLISPDDQQPAAARDAQRPTRGALIGIVQCVLAADEREQARKLAWATRKLRRHATAGHLDSAYVQDVVEQLRTAVGGA